MSRRMVIMLLLSAVLFGGVFGMKWFGSKKMNEFLNAMPAPAVTVSSAIAEEMSWESRLESVGSLVAVNGADLTAEVDGVVTNIYFESGDTVKRGDLLLSMASASEQGELKRLQAQAELTELNRKRSEQLYERKTISKSEYDTAVAETNVALAAVQAQKGRLEQKSVKAPFDGQLGIRRVNVGQYLGVGVAIATLQKLDPINVDFSMPERYLSILAPGLKVSVTVDAYGDKNYEGQVLAIEPKVNPQTRNVDVRARLSNPDGLLKPGLFATVVVSLPNSDEVTVIPRSAVNYTSYGDSVFVIQKNPDAPPPPDEPNPMMGPYTDLEVIQRFVTLGDARGDYIVVSKGLAVGDELASSGLLKLRNKQPVIVDNSNALAPELDPHPPEG
ncbi:efflux RND transporter periplasmic adaptor subunit [Zhongshania aliphaticivorans]|uniref:efflux RND transporter periplasmic adaptor subunit n=1 Tax=Zhongshania aliphaticivorans TaxID=1470434 RepID=UPI0012E694B3|nr:efflux RND transporter periplasmic adaptor subunit [Zhongshania aliphaticivorans]CAA0082981.1 Efflux pump periplasmic linker BepF [Zhongshania aliphaticivorans]